jgi:hypothetical protein
MAQTVYLLATVTSLACALMLWRGYSRSGTKFLLWSSLCFFGLALNNVLLFVDLVLVPEIDLSLWRNLAALAGLGLLLYGLIWDTA